jgi:hypothetical protein
MVKLVIRIDLNAQSVCTYQIWNFLILWCSTRSEDSIGYKFLIFGLTELKIRINQANRRFDSNLKIVSNWTHKIWVFIALLDSKCSKDSNEISFVIFGPTDQMIWILQDLDQFWFGTSIRISVLTEGCHVAHHDWPILIRLDHELRPLDLMLIGWTRWLHTCSLKWINPGHLINIGRTRESGKEPHRVRVPVNFSGEVCALESNSNDAPVGSGRRRRCDGLQRGVTVSGTWSLLSISSCRGRGRPLETGACRWSSGFTRGRRSAAVKTRKRGQGGAPGRGRKVGGEKEESGSPWAPNRSGDARRHAELRR